MKLNMAKLWEIILTGKSWKKYTFNVYLSNTEFKNVGGVYLISKRNHETRKHNFIYIGQTQDLSTRFDNHHRQDCFDRHWYNCISVHSENNETVRLQIEKDLIDGIDTPCNKEN